MVGVRETVMVVYDVVACSDAVVEHGLAKLKGFGVIFSFDYA